MKRPFLSILKCCITVLPVIGFLTLSAQGSGKASWQQGSIEEQFDHVIKRSNRYKENDQVYRVVRDDLLMQLSDNVDKAVGGFEVQLEKAERSITDQQQVIDSLNKELASIDQALRKANREKSNMNFLGVVPMKKGMYRTTMWAIVCGLVITLVIFLLRFIRNNVITRQTRKQLDKTREEFEAYRKKAMEDELVLRRKLQTEINKRL